MSREPLLDLAELAGKWGITGLTRLPAEVAVISVDNQPEEYCEIELADDTALTTAEALASKPKNFKGHSTRIVATDNGYEIKGISSRWYGAVETTVHTVEISAVKLAASK